MKQQVSGPLGIVIVVVVVAILLFFGYTKFLKGPGGSLSPEDVRANMAKGQQQQQNAGKPSDSGKPSAGPPSRN